MYSAAYLDFFLVLRFLKLGHLKKDIFRLQAILFTCIMPLKETSIAVSFEYLKGQCHKMVEKMRP
jgi:hypothetical protein